MCTVGMKELVPSKDMRKYLASLEWGFSDFEKAELVFNNDLLSLEEKEQYLVGLKVTTEDRELVNRVDRYFEHKKRVLRMFEKHDGFVYGFSFCKGGEEYFDGWFETLEAA